MQINNKKCAVKRVINMLSKKEQAMLLSFLDLYKYRYIYNNKGEYLFFKSNMYTLLVNKEILLENQGITGIYWKYFIAERWKKDDFKKQVCSIAYNNEDEELKLVVNKLRKFEELYDWLYYNKPSYIQDYINPMLKGELYSSYCINPNIKKYIWSVYNKIKKDFYEECKHSKKQSNYTGTSLFEEIETLFDNN